MLLALSIFGAGQRKMQQGAGGRVQEVPEEEEGDWVDLQELFWRFDRRFFHSRLSARVQVSWSSTLRRCVTPPFLLPPSTSLLLVSLCSFFTVSLVGGERTERRGNA